MTKDHKAMAKLIEELEQYMDSCCSLQTCPQCWSRHEKLVEIAKGAMGLRKDLESAENKLETIKCPQMCHGTGTCVDTNGEPYQCQWCDEIKREKKALSDFDSLLKND